MIDYSVIIRTTGKAGEKYRRLLDSIAKLEPQPQKVIVVLPEGYACPQDQLGWEDFYFCQKGMVRQRMFGISKCTTQYALITDDDIAFEPDFVQKLVEPLKNGKYGFSAGPLLDFFPAKGLSEIMSIVTGAALPTLWHKDRYNTVLKTTGYSYNRNIKVGTNQLYETQSAPWTCFFASMDALRCIHFEDESWLDRCGYSAHDDTTMFYKAWLCNKKAVIVADAVYDHLDAKTSTRGNHETAMYGTGFNTVVFWHRFIYERNGNVGKIWSKICVKYYLDMQKLNNKWNERRGKITHSERLAYIRGTQEAKKWLQTGEYKDLPQVIR